MVCLAREPLERSRRSPSKDLRTLSIVVYALFGTWLVSFAYEGQVLYALAARFHINPQRMVLGSIAAHVAGLLCCGLLVKTTKAAKHLMQFAIAFCIVGTSVFFCAPSALWTVSLPMMSFVAGGCTAAWSFYFRRGTAGHERVNTAADVLICSTCLMILIDMAADHLSPYLGLGLSMLALIGALLFSMRLPQEGEEANLSLPDATARAAIGKLLALLCLFIAVITVDSGLMFRVINPAFEHLGWLARWYWSVPYVAAMLAVKRLPGTVARAYTPYAAIAMTGFAFLAFVTLDRSVASYLIVDTLMLGACGVFDLFWWSILGGMLDCGKNAASIFGIGLSANVIGVLLGELIAGAATARGVSTGDLSLLALAVVFGALVLLPPLHRRLSILLKNQAFLVALPEEPPQGQPPAAGRFPQISGLTTRESQVVALLFRGYTHKMIAAELHLGESTVKTHIANVYSKLDVTSKVELIRKLEKADHHFWPMTP